MQTWRGWIEPAVTGLRATGDQLLKFVPFQQKLLRNGMLETWQEISLPTLYSERSTRPGLVLWGEASCGFQSDRLLNPKTAVERELPACPLAGRKTVSTAFGKQRTRESCSKVCYSFALGICWQPTSLAVSFFSFYQLFKCIKVNVCFKYLLAISARNSSPNSILRKKIQQPRLIKLASKCRIWATRSHLLLSSRDKTRKKELKAPINWIY